MNDNLYKVVEVDINDILPNRFQPRIQFDEEEIFELSDSIKEHGVIQPIVVRTIGDKYEIIAGERRYKASVLAGKETVPVIIKNLNDKDSAEIALIENIQRKNLTPIEEALSYKKILDMGYLTQESLANKIGKSQSSVANKVRLLNLSDEVQEALLDNKISERHARSLLRLKSITEQNKMLDKIIEERLTVRRTDEEIDKVLDKKEETIKENELKEKEEKGEENMNNEINQNLNVITPDTMNSFDIFGGASQPYEENISTIPFTQPIVPNVPSMPVIEPVMPAVPEIPVMQPTPVQEPQIGGIQFDTNGNVVSMGNPVVPNVPSIPVIEPVMPAVPEIPVMQPTPVQEPQIGGIQFDTNGNVVSMGNPVVPNVPSMPVIEPVMPAVPEIPVMQPTPVQESQIGGIQFDTNGNVVSMGNPIVPNVPSMPVIEPVMPAVPEIPVMQPTPVQESQIGGIQFDANGNVVSMGNPVVPNVPSMPVIEPVMPAVPEMTVVPQTSPIIESELNNNVEMSSQPTQPFVSNSSFEPATINNSSSISQPIIITDYNKQYDPVLPGVNFVQSEKVDFKDVINAIRECSNKIEKYGYRIDVEEYDLSTSYQVVFKVEK